ncbi:MAG TPA: cysteine desulfurase, partial [bacterium]|nr:cysteine desulfurase [bacterium]
MKKHIYLDYSATTPVDPKVLRAMLPYLRKEFANPSSIHQPGQRARAAVDESRKTIADFLNCFSDEIIFTGSASEANNTIIQKLIENKKKKGKLHIITSQIEHKAVLMPCEMLEKKNYAEVTYLPVYKDGVVKVSDVKKAIKGNTVLVSIIFANNEIGSVQPISEIGKVIEDINKKRKPSDKVYFHTDAVQGVNYLERDVNKLGVDFLVFSGHKIYAPKGIGAFYIKKGSPITPLIYGGGHEFGLRSGTENVAGIVALATAVKEIQDPRARVKNIRIRQLRDKLIKRILKDIPDSKLNGSLKNRLPNNANFSILGAEGEALVIA